MFGIRTYRHDSKCFWVDVVATFWFVCIVVTGAGVFFLIHYRPFPVARLRMPFEEGQMEICRPLQAVGTFGDLGKTKHRHVSEHIGIHELQGPTRHGEIWNCCHVRSDLWRVARKAYGGMDREHRRGQEKLQEIIEYLGMLCLHGMIHDPLKSVVLELHFVLTCFNYWTVRNGVVEYSAVASMPAFQSTICCFDKL